MDGWDLNFCKELGKLEQGSTVGSRACNTLVHMYVPMHRCRLAHPYTGTRVCGVCTQHGVVCPIENHQHSPGPGPSITSHLAASLTPCTSDVCRTLSHVPTSSPLLLHHTQYWRSWQCLSPFFQVLLIARAQLRLFPFTKHLNLPGRSPNSLQLPLSTTPSLQVIKYLLPQLICPPGLDYEFLETRVCL